MDIHNLRIDLIDEDTDQPRYQFDDEALQELMNSIGELGLLSPIKVRTLPNGRYKIIYGNRRYKACSMLGLPTVPCIVSAVTDETEIYLEQIAENLTREGFSPIEEAEAFHKMLNDSRFSCSTKFLSGKLGKPENYIKNKLELLKFGSAVKKLIVAGSEIRKDRLTEDQVLPLKDLPMEYRDTLALTFARDETPVPDIKRIAKLFKDESVSDGLKGKLLYKSGYELLETWSTFEHNRKERAKREKERAEAEEAARLEAEERARAEAAAQTGSAAQAGSAAGLGAAGGAGLGSGGLGAAASGAGGFGAAGGSGLGAGMAGGAYGGPGAGIASGSLGGGGVGVGGGGVDGGAGSGGGWNAGAGGGTGGNGGVGGGAGSDDGAAEAAAGGGIGAVATRRGVSPVAVVEQEIARLLAAIPTAAALEDGADLPALDSLRYDQLANLGDDVDRLLAEFERQAAEWRRIRSAINTRLS
ncbi:ParB/RepB/Spo0J family partition protein [Cohnella fermenti]|uniref:ParB/RepB/Spo0J family partition protein n=1 Tax=Cohnella fermenti TaxID=2565925 RepID=A0A4S4CAY5_9BACL|nr:ParB/RepB/Spo0J family partition protein [Cohnella fermenti]THF84603.1 ParB/RepB/Spo0J family partition protein [Cohnella fermenti]